LIHTACILSLDCGLRASEWITLTVDRVDFDAQTITVAGKGAKDRCLPVSYESLRLLRLHLNERRVESAWVFATDTGNPLSTRDALKRLKKLAIRCGVPSSVNLHGLRHSFATRYASSGGGIAALQVLLGHSEITTTQKYIHVSGQVAREAHKQFSPISRLSRRK
jgi:site-specific recombinase XerD